LQFSPDPRRQIRFLFFVKPTAALENTPKDG
jgi:hypothetical protein